MQECAQLCMHARKYTHAPSSSQHPPPPASPQMGKVRVRQHVNPLRAEYLQPLGPIDWGAAFSDPSLPLVVDLGCGPGRFLLLLQRRAAAGRVGLGVPAAGRCNYLGVEIRRAVSSV